MANKQIDALKNINFKGNVAEFKEAYNIEIDYLGRNNIRDIKHKQIILADFLHLKNQKEISQKISVKKLTWGYNTFVRYVKEFIKEQNLNYERKKYMKRLKLSGNVKIDKNNYYIYLTVLGTEQKELVHSSKPIEDIIKKKMALFLDKTNKELYFVKGDRGIVKYLRFHFMKKGLKINLVETKEFPIDFFKNLFDDEKIKIYKIELKNTEISIGDEITIYSKMGEGKKYYKKFAQSKILQEDRFDIYDVKKIIFSYKNLENCVIEFRKKKDFNKEIILKGKNQINLPDYIKKIINKENYWYSKLDNKKMLNLLIYNGYIDLYNKAYNKTLTSLMDNLEFNKFLTSNPVKGYRCENPSCNLFNKPVMNEKCSDVKCLKKNKEYIKYHKIELNYEKIIAKTGNSLKKGGFIQRYKTLDENSFELKASSPIIRLENKKGDYAYVLFNKEGLIKEDILKIKRYGLPFLVLNFKGELEQEFGSLIVRNAGDLFLSIIDGDFKPFTKALKQLSKNLYPIKMDAFDESLKAIKSQGNISPNDFEAIIFSLFNLMFPDCIKWGGPKVADGGCIFNLYQNNYLIWDAKRYNTSSLLNYVRHYLEKKDVNYLKRFNESKLVKKNGKLKYYMYITSNTSKTEFISIKDEFRELVKRDADLRKLVLLCINKSELIKFVEFFKKYQREFIDSNKAKFLTIVREGFIKNGGYFYFKTIKEDLEKFIKKRSIVPTAKELRKIV